MRLRDIGKIAADTRLQVDLVPAHSVLWLFVVEEQQVALDPVYNAAVAREIDAGAYWKTGQGAHIFCANDDIVRREHPSLAECRHGAFVILGVARPTPVRDGVSDLCKGAAP